jgi:hypothetical protein
VLVAGKLDHAWTRPEDPIGAHVVIEVYIFQR